MRWTAKAPLFAGVAAIALSVGFVPQGSHSTSSTIYDAAPIQIGSTAHAQARISVGVFFDRLQPHGRWVHHRSHGYVFVPAGVGRNWRPYTVGRWVYTNDYGWYWVSEEPFGWATYHYGRWGYSRTIGWYWVPGNVWAPAWVTWRTGGDVIGWAPLAPEGRGYAWGVPATFRPAVAESWVFVEIRHISAPTLVQYVTPISEIPVYLGQATTRVDLRVDQNIVINQPIEINQIQNVVVEPVQTVELSFADDPEQVAVSDGQVIAFQAEIAEEEPEEVPENAADSTEEIAEPAVLEETLDDVPDEADAPSAAQVEDEPGTPEEDPGAEPEEAPADEGEPALDAESDPAEAGETAPSEEAPAEEAAPEEPEAAPADAEPEAEAEAEADATAEPSPPADEAEPDAAETEPAETQAVEPETPEEIAPDQEPAQPATPQDAPAPSEPEAPEGESEAAPDAQAPQGQECPEGQENC